MLATRQAVETRRSICRACRAKYCIAKRKKESKLQGLDLSKRRENEIGKEWRGGEAVYAAEGVGSRQWRVDSSSEADPVTRADGQLRCGADSPRSGATGERGSGREPRRLSGSLPGGAAGAQAPHKTDRFLVTKGEAQGPPCLRLKSQNPDVALAAARSARGPPAAFLRPLTERRPHQLDRVVLARPLEDLRAPGPARRRRRRASPATWWLMARTTRRSWLMNR